MPPITGPVIAETATWLSIVSQLFGNRMGALLKPHGLTLGQFSILHHVARPRLTGAMRVSDIAAAVEVGQPAVTKALAKFQAMGLVEIEADQADRRARGVRPTPRAAELLDTVYRDIGPDLYRTFEVLGEEDIEAFARQLKRLGQWLDTNRLP